MKTEDLKSNGDEDVLAKTNRDQNNSESRKREIIRYGISAAPGIVIGTAFVVDSQVLRVPRTRVSQDRAEAEIVRFQEALDITRGELLQIKSDLADQLGDDHAKIFDAHMLILDDVMVKESTESLIRAESYNAAWALDIVISKIVTSLGNIGDEYLKDRSADILDVKQRVLRKLLGIESEHRQNPTEPSIIVAHELSPSETAQLDRRYVLGYATDLGGRTSHTAIMARSQGVPAVVGLEDTRPLIETGDTVVLDGNCGTIVINPLDGTRETYEKEIEHWRQFEEQLLTLTGYPAETLDHRKIELMANIDLPEEVASALDYGAEGVGLFRTEYFFIAQDQLPTEEEQYRVYRTLVEKMKGKPVTIRVLDIGGDKIAGYLHNSPELNPFMGWRGIRFLLTRKDIFKTQLRAIYRASAHGPVRMMFPLIVGVDEVVQAKKICEEIKHELTLARYKIDPDVEIGIMIETPSAVVLANALAKEVDFFSIGTNDLIQYTMAVDRGNTKISHLYQHLHPSIIRFLKMTADSARKNGVPAAICGEMCVDPMSAVVLVGLGLEEFSCSPNLIPEVKKTIRSVTFDECKTLVKKILKLSTTDKIEKRVWTFLKERCPDLSMFAEGKQHGK
ncbi:MAG: phosphoenolpyruvate--protein phosphotransferase [Candidatus Latescibacterota bacterium]|nr:MAG: phosphoenolpyruvate--protein phosphotransferase [Candidatus Latescibacterota bacterium]